MRWPTKPTKADYVALVASLRETLAEYEEYATALEAAALPEGRLPRLIVTAESNVTGRLRVMMETDAGVHTIGLVSDLKIIGSAKETRGTIEVTIVDGRRFPLSSEVLQSSDEWAALLSTIPGLTVLRG